MSVQPAKGSIIQGEDLDYIISLIKKGTVPADISVDALAEIFKYAAKNGDSQIVTILADKIPSNKLSELLKLLLEDEGFGFSLELIKLLGQIDYGLINIKKARKDELLRLAVKKGDADVVKVLIEAEADPYALEKSFKTAIELAVKYGFLNIVAILMQIEVDAKFEVVFDQHRLIGDALDKKDLAQVIMLIEKIIESGKEFDFGVLNKVFTQNKLNDLFKYTVAKGNIVVTELLLEKAKIDPYIYMDALKLAAENGNIEVVRVLLAQRVVQQMELELAQQIALLPTQQPVPVATNQMLIDSRQAAFDLAIGKGHFDVAAEFIKSGASFDHVSKGDLNKIFVYAVDNNDIKAVSQLATSPGIKFVEPLTKVIQQGNINMAKVIVKVASVDEIVEASAMAQPHKTSRALTDLLPDPDKRLPLPPKKEAMNALIGRTIRLKSGTMRKTERDMSRGLPSEPTHQFVQRLIAQQGRRQTVAATGKPKTSEKTKAAPSYLKETLRILKPPPQTRLPKQQTATAKKIAWRRKSKEQKEELELKDLKGSEQR